LRPRSETIARIASARRAWIALALTSCGTLAAPSTGDVDLPSSFVGPFLALRVDQTPNGSNTLVRADTSNAQVDEPSIVRVTPDARRIAYVTFRTNGMPDAIGRAAERMDRAAGSLAFEGAVAIFHAEQPWEGDFVRSPDVRAIDASHFVMAYAARGGIGIATSSDGTTFTHPSAPAIPGDVMDGGSDGPAEPSIARDGAGNWYLVFRRGTALFLARATDPSGAWEVSPTPILTPTNDPAVPLDSAAAFDAYGLSDPALSILTTPAGRALFVVYYTASGALPRTTIGAAASYDPTGRDAGTACVWCRVPRAIYTDRINSVRAGSLDVVDDRTALLWIGTGAANARAITALIGPSVGRLSAPGS
jgi:hypothetical protein